MHYAFFSTWAVMLLVVVVAGACRKSKQGEPYGDEYTTVTGSIRSGSQPTGTVVSGSQSNKTWTPLSSETTSTVTSSSVQNSGTSGSSVFINAPSSQTNSSSFSISIDDDAFVQYSYTVIYGDGECSTGTFSAWTIGSEPIVIEDNESDGGRKLCVVGRDVYGHETYYEYSWVKDTSPPTAELNDSFTERASGFDVTVNGEGVDQYKYAYLTGTSACSTASYGDWRNQEDKISDSFSQDTSQLICVIAKDVAGNEQSTPTTYLRPFVELQNAPDAYSNDATLDIIVSGVGVAEYKYAVYSGTAACVDATYSAWKSIDTKITDATGADGPKRLCVDTRSSTGIVQNVLMTFDWVNDSTPPDPPTLTGTPIVSPTNVTTLDVTVSGSDVYFYQYSVLTGAVSCNAATYSSWYGITQKITASTGSDGGKLLCVRSRDRALNEQSTVTSFSWDQDATAPTATLTGAPTAGQKSLATVLNVSVGPGGDATEYRYALLSGTTNCSSATYSGWIDVSTAITDNLGSDDVKTLCISAHDAVGNIQSSPTVHSWTKDTTPPNTTLGNVPSDPSNSTNLDVSISDNDTDQYKYAVTTAVNCTGVTYSAFISASTHMTDALGGDTTYRICVLGMDAVGNVQASPSEYSWTKDTTAPSAAALTLTGTPVSPSKVTTLAVTVNGSDIEAYKYKVGVNGSTDCTNSTGYSATEYDRASQSIGASVSALSDGSIELCVWGRDAAGNYQALADAKSFTWVKDTAAPSASLSNLPTDPSADIALAATVSAESGSDTYRYKLGTNATTDCSNSSGYSGSDFSVAVQLTDNLTGFSDGSMELCVIAKDQAGNEQATSAATTYVWVKDNNPPSLTSSTITPSNVDLSSMTLTWTKGSDTVTTEANLRYKICQCANSVAATDFDDASEVDACEGIAGCSVIQGYTANIATLNVTGLTSNTEYLFNVVVKDDVNRLSAYSILTQRTPPAVHVIYKDSSGSQLMYTKTSTSVSTFETPVTIASGIADASAVAMDLDSNGKAYVSFVSSQNLYCSTNKTGAWAAYGSTPVDSGLIEPYTALAVDTSGNTHIAYFRFDSQKDWKHQIHNGTSWLGTSGKIFNGNGGIIRGKHSAIAFDSVGNLHAVSHDESNQDLIYNVRTAGSWGTVAIIDNGANPPIVGQFNGIAIDPSNDVHVSYYDVTNGDLKYIKRTSGTWGAGVTLESTNNVGQYSGIAVTPDGKIHIVYYDVTNGDLRYLCHNGTAWQTSSVIDGSSPAIDVGKYTAVAAGKDNVVHVSYYDATNLDLKYAKGSCGGSWTIVTLASTGDVGAWTDIVLDK